MKKHIFGAALFSLIVASFAFIYAFLYAPSIPPKEAVKPPLSQTEVRTEKPTYCNLKRNKLTYDVQSSQFDLDDKKLTSTVKITWNGSGEPPKEVFGKTELFTLDRKDFSKSFGQMTFTKVFENRNEATLIVVAKLDKSDKTIDERQNLYVSFNFSEIEDAKNDSSASKNLTEVHQVLFVHGKKPSTIMRADISK